jgi:hypothetical protein
MDYTSRLIGGKSDRFFQSGQYSIFQLLYFIRLRRIFSPSVNEPKGQCANDGTANFRHDDPFKELAG